jgi:hypothetical protein
MARSTGPILAIGGITLANQVLLTKDPPKDLQGIDWRVPVGTAVAAAGFALLEQLSEGLAVGLAWVALVTVLFVDLSPDKKTKAPTENLLDILEGKRK